MFFKKKKKVIQAETPKSPTQWKENTQRLMKK